MNIHPRGRYWDMSKFTEKCSNTHMHTNNRLGAVMGIYIVCIKRALTRLAGNAVHCAQACICTGVSLLCDDVKCC